MSPSAIISVTAYKSNAHCLICVKNAILMITLQCSNDLLYKSINFYKRVFVMGVWNMEHEFWAKYSHCSLVWLHTPVLPSLLIMIYHWWGKRNSIKIFPADRKRIRMLDTLSDGLCNVVARCHIPDIASALLSLMPAPAWDPGCSWSPAHPMGHCCVMWEYTETLRNNKWLLLNVIFF